MHNFEQKIFKKHFNSCNFLLIQHINLKFWGLIHNKIVYPNPQKKYFLKFKMAASGHLEKKPVLFASSVSKSKKQLQRKCFFFYLYQTISVENNFWQKILNIAFLFRIFCIFLWCHSRHFVKSEASLSHPQFCFDFLQIWYTDSLTQSRNWNWISALYVINFYP